ncbi:hypothetical protein ACR6C2_18200 [Streptomyces sp. INA 01156]
MAVWLVGCALTYVQLMAVLVALFTGGAAPFTAVLVGVAFLSVVVLAGLGTAVRTVVPLMRRARGLWAWAVSVYALGTVGAFGAAVVNFKINHLENGLLLYLAGGTCYALAAALFLPGARVRLRALGAATLLVVGGVYATWAATQPPLSTSGSTPTAWTTPCYGSATRHRATHCTSWARARTASVPITSGPAPHDYTSV